MAIWNMASDGSFKLGDRKFKEGEAQLIELEPSLRLNYKLFVILGDKEREWYYTYDQKQLVPGISMPPSMIEIKDYELIEKPYPLWLKNLDSKYNKEVLTESEKRIRDWCDAFSLETNHYIRCDNCKERVENRDDIMLATVMIIEGWVIDEGDYLCKACITKRRNGEVLQFTRPGRIKMR